MKKALLMGLVAFGLSQAAIIPKLEVATGAIDCNGLTCTYTYTASVNPEAELHGTNSNDPAGANYFTIYDFNGYVAGSEFAPADWKIIVGNTGWTPARIPVPEDDPTIENLTFVYTGATPIMGGVKLGGFGAESIFGPAIVPDVFTSQATNVIASSGNTLTIGFGYVDVPARIPNDANVPEPMSMSLIGGGLLGLGLFRRFRK